MNSTSVAIVTVKSGYPSEFPYHPDINYPEYNKTELSSSPNDVYDGIRNLFIALGYDQQNLGTAEWNPLGWLIRPGQRVFIKPNFVSHEFRKSAGYPGDVYSVITHPSVIRAVTDYVAIALKGCGEIIIGDNPSIDADFDKLDELTRIKTFESHYQARGVKLKVLDLRPERTAELHYYGCKGKTVTLPGDPEGSSIINLGKHSYFAGLNPLLFRGVFSKDGKL